jgi:hypothetical protein
MCSPRKHAHRMPVIIQIRNVRHVSYRELKERAAFEPPTYTPASRAIVIDGFTIPEVERSIPNGIVRPTPFHREDRQPLTHPFALALYRCHSERSRGTSFLVPSAAASQPDALFAPAHVNVDEKSLSFRDWKISDPSSVPLSQNATIPGLVVRSGFLDIYPARSHLRPKF